MEYASKVDDNEVASTVTLQFVATGNAPLMKRNKFTVNGNDNLSVVYKFLKKQLRLKDSDSLFVYCNSSFAPSPDQKLSSLFECIKSDKSMSKAALHGYEAWLGQKESKVKRQERATNVLFSSDTTNTFSSFENATSNANKSNCMDYTSKKSPNMNSDTNLKMHHTKNNSPLKDMGKILHDHIVTVQRIPTESRLNSPNQSQQIRSSPTSNYKNHKILEKSSPTKSNPPVENSKESVIGKKRNLSETGFLSRSARSVRLFHAKRPQAISKQRSISTNSIQRADANTTNNSTLSSNITNVQLEQVFEEIPFWQTVDRFAMLN